jgi:hypothetical protein
LQVTECILELRVHAKKRAVYMDIVGEADEKGAFDAGLLLSLLGEAKRQNSGRALTYVAR